MATPTRMDEYFVHQTPDLLPHVAVHHPHWRESYFFDIHEPSGEGDVAFLTMAHQPQRGELDSLQMGRLGGEAVLGRSTRPGGDDPHTTVVPGVTIEVVEPWQEVRLVAEPDHCPFGIDATFRARTLPYALRRGTMRAGHELVWDQSHIFQSGTYEGTLTVDGVTREIDGWIGQRDHSWGIRDHGRCPLWLWWQVQLDDGFLGVWHWELANGARVYTDGCWAGTDGGEPIPVVDFRYDAVWTGADDDQIDYGTNGDDVAGLRAACQITLEGGRVIEIEAAGSFARPYEPFHRGGLNLMRVRTSDGRTGTAVYEVTGARHHRFFPDTDVTGALPS